MGRRKRSRAEATPAPDRGRPHSGWDTVGTQLRLLGTALVAAGLLAGLMAANRPFFERQVRETYAARPGPSEVDLAYERWMTGGGTEEMAREMLRQDGERVLARVERTLVVGSAQQRSRCLRLVEMGGHPAAAPVLERALRWFRARREAEAADQVQEALRSVGDWRGGAPWTTTTVAEGWAGSGSC